LFEEQIAQIGHYGAVILAGRVRLECPGADLLEYVRNGGTLVVAGNTAQYNEWRERRRVNPCSRRGSKARANRLYSADRSRGRARVESGGGRSGTRTGSRAA